MPLLGFVLGAAAPPPASFDSTVLGLSPAFYWELEDAVGSTTLADSSGNGHTLTNTSLTLGEPGIVPSDSGTCAYSNSASNTASSAFKPSIASSVAISVAAVVQFSAFPGTVVQLLNNLATTVSGLSLRLNPSNEPAFVVANGSTDATATITTALTAGHTYLIVGTYSGTTITLYAYDLTAGAQLATATATLAAGTFEPTVSWTMDGATHYVGRVAFFETALTAAQVASLYDAATTSEAAATAAARAGVAVGGLASASGAATAAARAGVAVDVNALVSGVATAAARASATTNGTVVGTGTRSMGDGTYAGWQSWVANGLPAPALWAYGPAWTAAELSDIASTWPDTKLLALDDTGSSPDTCQVIDVESVDVTSAATIATWINDRLAYFGSYELARPTIYVNVNGKYYYGAADDIFLGAGTNAGNGLSTDYGLYAGVHYDLWLADCTGTEPSAPYNTPVGPGGADVGSVATQYADYTQTGYNFDFDAAFDSTWYAGTALASAAPAAAASIFAGGPLTVGGAVAAGARAAVATVGSAVAAGGGGVGGGGGGGGGGGESGLEVGGGGAPPPIPQSVAECHAASHQITSRVFLLLDGTPAVQIGNLLVGGTVTLDTTSEQMRTCSFQLVDDPVYPVPAWFGKLKPTGARVSIQQALYVNGVANWFDLGIFGVEEVDEETSMATPGPVYSVTGYDVSASIEASLFTAPFTANKGKPAHEVVYEIVRQQYPSQRRFNLKPTNMVPYLQQWQTGDDPWAACVELAQSAGCVLYADRSGTLVMRDVPTGANSPIAIRFDRDGMMTATDIKRTVNNQPGYNGLQVTGSNAAGKTVTVTVWDTNPSSPTYYKGPYGMRPAPPVMPSSVITPAQALALAKRLLPSVVGLTRQTTVTAIPAPWLDAFDLAWIYHEELGLAQVEMVTGFTMPLDYSQLMQLTTVPLSSPPSEYVADVAALTENLPPTFGVVL